MKSAWTYILLIIIAVLLGIYFFLGKSNSTDQLESAVFKVSDISSIHQIDIKSKRLEDMSIQRSNGNWILQRGHKVRSNAMSNLIEVLEHIEIQYIPQRAAIQNIQKEFNDIGIEVDIYSEDGSLIRSYIVGGSTSDERGTYMKLANLDQPYVMHLPGLEGSVRGRFLHNYDNWRDRTILKEDPSNLVEVRLDYHRQNIESFQLTGQTLTQTATGTTISANQKTDAYLLVFEELVAEAYENSNSNKDSIRTMLPFVTISTRDKNQKEKWLKLYPIENFVGENLVSLNDTERINRYFVDTSWGDFALLQQRLVGKYLRGYSYFTNDE